MPKVNAQKTLGLFSEPSYMSLGDPYDPPVESGGRHKGLNIMTQNVKKGAVPCGTHGTNFDLTFRRISDGDTYLMPGALERKWRKEAWTKCRTSEGFRFTSPAKHRTGLGDTCGNFNADQNGKRHQWPEFIPRGGMEKKTKDDIAPPAKPNIMTNPVKKGSYGYTTKNFVGRGTEYSYAIDPYDRPREMEIEERKKFKEKTAFFGQGRPFNTSSHARDCYDKDIYTDPEALRGGYRPPKPEKSLEGKAPFLPSQPPKTLTAFTGCFTKFPTAIPDPPNDVRAGASGEGGEKAVFVPSSPAKSTRTKSIMFRNM